MQQHILGQVLCLLRADEHVLGCVISGSYARGVQDAFSDLDIACYFHDEERTGMQAIYERVGAIAPTLWRLFIYDVHALYLFENGVRLDLDFLKPSDIENPSYVYTDLVILHDLDGKLQPLAQRKNRMQPAEHPKWFAPGDPDMIDWFFWMFRQVVCWAKRGAQGNYRAYEKLSNAVDSLAQVRTRLIEMRLWTLGYKDYLGRADPACASRLANTYPHLDASEIIACTRLMLAEYAYICPLYCQKAGVVYPARKVEIMYRLIDEFERLR